MTTISRTTRLGATIIAAAFALSIVAYPHLPRIVAVHWDISGQPNGYGSRLMLCLVGPAAMGTVMLALAYADRSASLFKSSTQTTPLPGQRRTEIYSVLGLISLAGLLTLHALALSSATGILPSRRVPVIAALLVSTLLVALGNYLPRVTERNAFFGVRLPWLFASDHVWRRTQRAAGYGMVAAGTAGLVSVLVYPSRALVVVVVAAVINTLAISVYSFRLARM